MSRRLRSAVQVVRPGRTWRSSDRSSSLWGRLSPEKNHADLVTAFSRLPGAARGTLLILGEGPERSALEQLGRELDIGSSLVMPGFVEDVALQLGDADLAVWTSHYEAFSIAMLEAASLGVPVVTYDTPHGPRELATFFPDLVRLVGCGDVDALVAAMAQSLREHDRQERAVHVPEEFTVHRFTAQFIELLEGSE